MSAEFDENGRVTFDLEEQADEAKQIFTHVSPVANITNEEGSVIIAVGERELGDGREAGLEENEAPDEDAIDGSAENESREESPVNSQPTSPELNLEEIHNEFSPTSLSAPCILPWGARKERQQLHPSNITIENDLRPGEFVMKTLFAEFTVVASKKIEVILQEPLERSLSKSLQRGEDPMFDQLLSAFGNVSEQCLPSLLRTLFAWYSRQGVAEWGSMDAKYKQDPSKKGSDSWSASFEKDQIAERRDLAVDFIFCLVLIEVLKQFPVHPGHEDLVRHVEDIAFKHFKYREGVQNNPNGANINIIADLYAEVVGVLAQTRFQSVRRCFMTELKELRAKEASAQTTQSIASLLMGMKFFRVKMVPIEEFEASFQFMQECANYFLEVRDKDIKHALAGLFVEILVPVAASVKNEVNVPCLKNFVDMLYTVTLDMATKNKHRLAIFPLVTCLLCVSQKSFFLSNWHYFLAMCLQHLKNRDPKMSRVALESLFRLLWVYMIRIKCESNQATHSRLASIVNSLFPKGSKAVVPRDTPLNIFVKIIQFIAQERIDFAMREIIFDLLSVGRPIKIILTPERMSIGLRAFLVVADNLQQREGDPPMPRTVGVLPSGNTLRVKKTFLNKMLTEDTARNIGISAYYPLVRKAFNDILKALDSQYGKSLMMSTTQNVNKEPDEVITGERKPKIDLFRTCVAAIPRLIPDGMSAQDLVDLLSRLTVHVDEELRALAFQSLQNLVIDFPEWRHDVVHGFIQFLVKEVSDTMAQLLDNGLRMLLQLLSAWRTALTSSVTTSISKRDPGVSELNRLQLHQRDELSDVLYFVEGFAFVMLCCCRQAPRRVAVAILKEIRCLSKVLIKDSSSYSVIDVMDQSCRPVLDKVVPLLPPGEKSTFSSTPNVDVHWLVERNSSIWTGGFHDDSLVKSTSIQHLAGTEDVWPLVLVGFLHKDRVFSLCPQAITHMWPVVYTRINALYSLLDPLIPNENRASFFATQMKKSFNERDNYLSLWRNYIVVACRVIPSAPKATVIRCSSPDISLGSSPDSWAGGGGEKGPEKPPTISPQCLYKLLVPLLRCDAADMRDSATLALGNLNHLALSQLMEELLPYIKESIDRKQENMRRRRRRDALRLQLVKVFEMCAEGEAFAFCQSVIDSDSGSLQKQYLEYIDGARVYLEGETDKDNTLLQIKMNFCNFIKKLIQSYSLERRQCLISRNLRRDLFYLFASWSGAFGAPFKFKVGDCSPDHPSDFELVALQASTSILCCGPIFDSDLVADEGCLYKWLNILFTSNNQKVTNLAEETIVLLLEFNPDSGSILDWVVDQCYTASAKIADSCFYALVTIFSSREYPCDRYTAVMNVTLMNTGCPRAGVHETALQLLQILDKRFFGAVSPIVEDTHETDSRVEESSTLDVLLSANYSRSQIYLSKQLAHLHPELTMPMFSEISYRLQTARNCVRQLLFQCMLPWLDNMELVDPAIPTCPTAYSQCFSENGQISHNIRKEGWGSAEATEMVLNNLFYLTVKFGDENPKEIEELWAAMSTCWPNNLRVIIRYLFIITAMAPHELLPYAKRVTVYVGRARPDRLVEELMVEMGTVETLNCVIERTETPPFFRLTSVRKTSSHGESGENTGLTGTSNEEERGGTLHTKRHSGENHELNKDIRPEQASAPGSLKSITSMASTTSSVLQINPPSSLPITLTGGLKCSQVPPLQASASQDVSFQQTTREDNFSILKSQNAVPEETDRYEPHPLPMPEYGGFFSPLTEYLPDSSQPIPAFHRCNLAVMLICDVIVAGIDVECHSVDWSIHIALMLHIIVLGLDHSRSLVYQHCKTLLIHLLTVIADHRDHLGVARVLLNNKTAQMNYGLLPPNNFPHKKRFTEENPQDHSAHYLDSAHVSYRNTPILPTSTTPPISSAPDIDTSKSSLEKMLTLDELDGNEPKAKVSVEASLLTDPPLIVTSEDNNDNLDDTVSNSSVGNVETEFTIVDDLQFNIKALIDFIVSSKDQPLWNFEDMTSKQFCIKSANQVSNFVRHLVSIFSESLPHAHIEERMAQIALHLALSCSSRHYAGRSLQVFRCLRVSMSSRMLTELLSRLVETVAEQGDDMQGYVTELMLTLEAAVDALHSDFRPIEFVRELFKSTPNLNNKGRKPPPNYSNVLNHYYSSSYGASNNPLSPLGGHFRSTSYTVSYGRMQPEMRQRSGTDAEFRKRNTSGNLCRSRSAQSLKQLADQSSAEDKMAVLAQLFWIAVSLLESDYEYEFVLAVRLLDKVLSRLSLDRPDCRDKVEKLQQQLKWKGFPGIHALLLKGCTSPTTYEHTVKLLIKLTQMTDLLVVDSSQSRGFPMNVIALLPYMLLHYEDASELCIQAAENIAQECTEKGKELENLSTVMTLYSRRNFSKESFQWTKCVVKYLHDSYAFLTPTWMTFLVEVLEKGPPSLQSSILNILHCMLHYIDMNSTSAHLINEDLLRVVAKYIEGSHWKEALRILKLAVTRSSSLVVPPTVPPSNYWDQQHMFTELEALFKKELPGRTMEFTFDVNQTPVIGRRYLSRSNQPGGPQSIIGGDLFSKTQIIGVEKEALSPQRSHSLTAADTPHLAGWRRPWLSQARVRERLVNLLNSCGQRVGLPKSPSVIFSQSSELERQSSMASSTEEVSTGQENATGAAAERYIDDMTSSEKQFAVFKDFDFLEYELESQEEESIDNFNLWGVRRRSPSPGGYHEPVSQQEDSQTDDIPSLERKPSVKRSRDWWEEDESISPSEDPSLTNTEQSTEEPSTADAIPLLMQAHSSLVATPSSLITPPISLVTPPKSLMVSHVSPSSPVSSKLVLNTSFSRRSVSPGSVSDDSSDEDLGDMTPCNASPGIASLLFRPIRQPSVLEETWRSHLLSLISSSASISNPFHTCCLFNAIYKDCVNKFCDFLSEGNQYLNSVCGAATFLKHNEVVASIAVLPYVYVDSYLVTSSGFAQKFKSTFIALNEHLDTYSDKNENAFMCLDTLRSTLKLQNFEELEIAPDDQQLEFSKCLCKLNFQITLLYDTYAKFIDAIQNAAKSLQTSDNSVELCVLRSKLLAAAEELDATPPCSPSRLTPQKVPLMERQVPEGGECDDSEITSIDGGSSTLQAIMVTTTTDSSSHSPDSFSPQASSQISSIPINVQQAHHQLLQLIADQEWTKAVQYARQYRNNWPHEPFAPMHFDDVTIILNTYCNYLSEKTPGVMAICGIDFPMDEMSRQLTDINMHALSSLRTMEQAAKQNRHMMEKTMRKTEC